MTFGDLIWHLAGFLLPAVFVGLIASAGVALLWRRAVRQVGWARLLAASCLACLVAAVLSLVVTGRDGTMAGYGAMVVACAVAQWWVLRRA